MTIFAGMEAIDTISQPNDNENMAFDLINTFIEEADFAEEDLNLDRMLIDEDKFNTAFEQLKALRDSIEEFGLSKGVIKAVDPDGYLEANGIIPAYEELNDLPTKGEYSKIALEGMKDKLTDIWEKIRKFMINFWGKIKSFLSKAIQLAFNYEGVLKSLKKKLSEKKEFDTDRADKKEFNIIDKTVLETALNYLNNNISKFINPLNTSIIKLIDQAKDTNKKTVDRMRMIYRDPVMKLKSESASLIRYAGIGIIEKNGDLSIKNKMKESIYSNKKMKKLKDHGYSSIDDVIKIIEEALNSYKQLKNFQLDIKQLDTVYKEFDKIADDIINKEKNIFAKDQISKNAMLIRNNISSITNFIRMLFSAYIKAIRSSIVIGNDALSVSK